MGALAASAKTAKPAKPAKAKAAKAAKAADPEKTAARTAARTAANLPTRSDEVTAPAGDMHLGMKAYIEELEAKVAAWAWDFRRRPLPGALTAGHKEDEYASVLPGVT
jgi:hypothetical protein